MRWCFKLQKENLPRDNTHVVTCMTKITLAVMYHVINTQIYTKLIEKKHKYFLNKIETPKRYSFLSLPQQLASLLKSLPEVESYLLYIFILLADTTI